MAEHSDFDRFYQSKWEQLKNATRLATEHRRRVKEGDLSVFLIPLVLALSKDFIFDLIPVIGILFGFFITVYLFIFMWGRGRIWLRFIFFIVAVLGLIPFIKLIPFETASVIFAFSLAKRDADKAKADLEKLNQALPKIAQGLKGAAIQRDRMLRAQAATQADEGVAQEQFQENAAEEAKNRTSQVPLAREVSGFSAAELARRTAQPGSFQPVSPNLQATQAGQSGLGQTAPSRLMDGARGQSARMRGRAADDSEYVDRKSTPQQAVSGSDIARVSQPMRVGTSPLVAGVPDVAATMAPAMSAGPSLATRTPFHSELSTATPRGSSGSQGTSYQSVPNQSGDAMLRIRAAGSQLSQSAHSEQSTVTPVNPAVPSSTLGAVPYYATVASMGFGVVPSSQMMSVSSVAAGAGALVDEGGSTPEKTALQKWQEFMRYEKENGTPLLREAQEHRNKLMEGRGRFLLSQDEFNEYFSKGSFASHEGLEQQNVGDCYAVAALHAFSQSPSFEMMVRSSMKRLGNGSWEVRIPLLDKNAETIVVSPEEIESQKNPGYLKYHGGYGSKGLLPDLRRKLDPVKGSEGYRVLETAFMKAKFGFGKPTKSGKVFPLNRLSAEGGLGADVLLHLGGKENFQPYVVSSVRYYDETKKKFLTPGLSSLSEVNMQAIDHFLEMFDPDVFIATANTKPIAKIKLSEKILNALGLLTIDKDNEPGKSFVSGHAYSLTKVDKERKIVILANPWNTKQSIELTFQQFKEIFFSLSAVRIHHGKLLGNMKSVHPNVSNV